MADIPENWIQKYVDQILSVAATLPASSLMRDAMLIRANHVMDLVQAFRESRKEQNQDKK